MREKVSSQKNTLKKHHAGRPDLAGTPEYGKEQLGDDGLYQK